MYVEELDVVWFIGIIGYVGFGYWVQEKGFSWICISRSLED